MFNGIQKFLLLGIFMITGLLMITRLFMLYFAEYSTLLLLLHISIPVFHQSVYASQRFIHKPNQCRCNVNPS